MSEDTNDLRAELDAINAKLDKLNGRVDAVAPAPSLEAALLDGTPPEETQADPKLLTRAELDKLTPEDVSRLDDTDATLIDRSLAAIGGNHA